MLTVGKILQEARRRKGWELEDVSRILKIQTRFLEALEKGDWQAFDSAAHLRGFLKNYASFLDLKVDEVLAFWRREYEPLGEERPALPPQPLTLPRVVLTPGLVVTALSGLFILLFLGYLGWRYLAFAGPPELTVINPSEGLTIREREVEIWGTTNQDAVLTINGQRLILNEDGSFSTKVSLNAGLNVLNFVAVNKLGRQRQVSRQVTVLAEELPRVAGEAIEKPEVPATPSAQEAEKQ